MFQWLMRWSAPPKNLTNRRQFRRVPLDLPLRVWFQGEVCHATLTNLSPDGFRLLLDRPLTPGDRVTVELPHGESAVEATVVWNTPLGEAWRVGLRTGTGLNRLCAHISRGRPWRDRRRHRRFLAGIPSLLEWSGGFSQVVCVDLCERGCQLSVVPGAGPIPKSALLRLGPLPGWHGLRLRATLAYQQPTPEGELLLGFRFQQSTPRLRSLLRNLRRLGRDKPPTPANSNWAAPEWMTRSARPRIPRPRSRASRPEARSLPRPPKLIKARRPDRCPSLWAARLLPLTELQLAKPTNN